YYGGKRRESRSYGGAYHVAGIVYPVRETHGVSGQCSQVHHPRRFRPDKSVKRGGSFQLRNAGHPAPAVHRAGVGSPDAAHAAEISQVMGGAVAVPEQRMIQNHITLSGGVERSASAG